VEQTERQDKETLLQRLAQQSADNWWNANPDGYGGLKEGQDLWLLAVADGRGEGIKSSCLGFHSPPLDQKDIDEGNKLIGQLGQRKNMEPAVFCANVLLGTTQGMKWEVAELPLLAAVYLMDDPHVDTLRAPLKQHEFHMLQFLVEKQGVSFSVSPFEKYPGPPAESE
jgi:hypothetical protein